MILHFDGVRTADFETRHGSVCSNSSRARVRECQTRADLLSRMFDLRNELSSLCDEGDAETNVQESLIRITEWIRTEGETAKEGFIQMNGFVVVMQFFVDACLQESAQVLSAWLDGEGGRTWPSWVVRRIVDAIVIQDTSPKLTEVALKLLMEGMENSADVRDTVFSEEGGQSLMIQLADIFASRPLLSWTSQGLQSFLSLLCVSDGPSEQQQRALTAIIQVARAVEVPQYRSLSILEARMRKSKEANYERDEEMLRRYTLLTRCLGNTIKSRPMSNVHDSTSYEDSPFLREIMQEIQGLLKSSPTKVHRILDWSGRLKAFEERRFGFTDLDGTSLLYAWLEIVANCMTQKGAAKILYQANMLGILDDLSSFSDTSLQECVCKVYGQMALQFTKAMTEVIEDKRILALCGLLTLENEVVALKGLEALAAKIDDLSGNHYIWFETSSLGLQRVINIYTSASSPPVKKQSKQVITRSLERHRQMHNLKESCHPMTHPWTLLVSAFTSETSTCLSTSDGNNHTTEQAKSKTVTSGQKKSKTSSTQIEEADRRDEGFDEDGLRMVFDSGPSEIIKRNREDWKRISLNDKIRWTQTTTDVLIWIVVPKGTRAKEISVAIEPCRLCVRLEWCGRVFDGPLHRRCKASEALWVLQDDEIHIILPKDDHHFWKALFEGGIEKSFIEIIQESVESDEPTIAYDNMDPRAKELIEEIRERQQMVRDGLIDLEESFDDFRIVVGENSL